MQVKAIPDGFHTVTPYFNVRGAFQYIEFLRRAFDAKDIFVAKDQFGGDRSGVVEDIAGNQWWIATHKEDVSAEELVRRAERMYT